jgi:hypothetical protein
MTKTFKPLRQVKKRGQRQPLRRQPATSPRATSSSPTSSSSTPPSSPTAAASSPTSPTSFSYTPPSSPTAAASSPTSPTSSSCTPPSTSSPWLDASPTPLPPPLLLASLKSSILPAFSLQEALRLSSLGDYLSNLRSYVLAAVASFIGRISGILLIIFHHFYTRELNPRVDNIPAFLLLLLQQPFRPVSAFVNARKAAVRPSTMLARLDDLSTFVSWFCFHDIARPELVGSIKDCIRGLRKNFSKLNKAQQSGKTLQTEVALRHLPEGANVVEQMAKLQQPILDLMEWARRFRSSTPPHITKEIYEEFMRLLYSSLYLFSPQGRISGSIIIPLHFYFFWYAYHDVVSYCCILSNRH